MSATAAAQLGASACLVFEFEQVLMRRVGARLVLHAWYPEWVDPSVIAGLPEPFELTDEPGRL